MSNKLIEIARFFDASDAHILRGILESEDINVVIFDEQFSSLTPVDSVISGGVKLYISEVDLEKAEPIISKYYMNLTRVVLDRCPECNSSNIVRDYKRQLKSIFYSILGVLFGTGFNRKTPEFKRCNSCQYEW